MIDEIYKALILKNAEFELEIHNKSKYPNYAIHICFHSVELHPIRIKREDHILHQIFIDINHITKRFQIQYSNSKTDHYWRYNNWHKTIYNKEMIKPTFKRVMRLLNELKLIKRSTNFYFNF